MKKNAEPDIQKLSESDLYEPVKAYLEGLGYEVKAEVRSCDITALRGEELIVVELKKGFTLELMYQAIERQRVADSVYVAVPFPKKGYMAPKYHDMVRLCRRLEIGLIWVAFSSKGIPQIDVAVHPAFAKPVTRNKKERLAVLSEHNGRTGSVNTGGVTRRKIITVYKEQALQIAEALMKNGRLSTTEIKELTGISKTSAILQRNFYKWYVCVEKASKNNIYEVTEEGKIALEEYKDLL